MALLSKIDIVNAFHRLGELAVESGYEIELLAVGGAVMVLRYQARLATHDIDAIILAPEKAHVVRQLNSALFENAKYLSSLGRSRFAFSKQPQFSSPSCTGT